MIIKHDNEGKYKADDFILVPVEDKGRLLEKAVYQCSYICHRDDGTRVAVFEKAIGGTVYKIIKGICLGHQSE